jgi:hypothetical protein
MKYSWVVLLFIFPFFMGLACDNQSPVSDRSKPNTLDKSDAMGNIRIKIGDKSFTAKLSENATTKAFMAMLPLTVSMTELNGNEKFFRLAKNLPTNSSNPGSIAIGDLMLWGSNTLVLFYETFSTSYDYTRLGKIDNPTGLAAALGAGNVIVTFEKE